MRNNKIWLIVYVFILTFALVDSVATYGFQLVTLQDSKLNVEADESLYSVEPVIYHPDEMDRDFDGIQDSLETTIHGADDANGSIMIPVVVTLFNPVQSRDLNHFTRLGGYVTRIYRYVTYGFAGKIPAANITAFAALENENLCMIEYDSPIRYHLDVSVPLIRARPIVWNTWGYLGSPNYSIAILDTGVDDSHPDVGPFRDSDFSAKMVGWYDATEDNSLAPEDYGEHGTHVAGIAVGTGSANSLQESGDVHTTFTYTLPQAGWGYIDYIDVMTPGFIELNCSWSGGNTVLLRLRNPEGETVNETSGDSSPLILTYNTTNTIYPIGRYQVLVGNLAGPSGNPFSCIETYPYRGLNDGYNLFSGVAPNSRLVAVKVFDNTGSGTISTLMAGMEWVIENRRTYRITVASMSVGLARGSTDSTLDQKADTMVKNGIVTTVAAGNDYPDYTIGSPGTAAYVITVAATNDQNNITSYSSNGDTSKNEYALVKPDVAAPGGTFQTEYGNRIISVDSNDVDAHYSGYPDQNRDDYQQMAGTSMATPHVAGLSALVIEALGGWNWTEEEALKVKMVISMTAFEVQSGESGNVPPLNRGGKDSVEGYGRICADAAIEAVSMNYTVGDLASDMLGSGPSDKKVWARKVWLSAKTEYEFNLLIPSNADYDLYLYDDEPDSYGQPIIVKKSVNATRGAEEIISHLPNASGTYYIVVKWVSGSGNFTLKSEGVPQHDVAVLGVMPSSTLVYAGEPLNITVTVKNEGGASESFNVTAFYDNNVIETQNVINLAAGAEMNLTFTWNTTGVATCINYTIRAEASVVQDEVNIDNNKYIDGEVKVAELLEGDLNNDGIVDIEDLATVGKAYGSTPEDPNWNSEADLNGDGVVNLYDLVIVAKNYGETVDC